MQKLSVSNYELLIVRKSKIKTFCKINFPDSRHRYFITYMPKPSIHNTLRGIKRFFTNNGMQ